MNELRTKINGTSKILGIILICATLLGSIVTSIRTYAKIDFISEQNNLSLKKQDEKLSTLYERIEKAEKDLSNETLRATMKDTELEKVLIEIKDDIKEIKAILTKTSLTRLKN